MLLQVQQNVVITDDEESNENPETDNTVPRDKNSIIVIDDSPPGISLKLFYDIFMKRHLHVCLLAVVNCAVIERLQRINLCATMLQ